MQFKLFFFFIVSAVLIHVCHPKGFLVGIFSGEIISEGISVAFKNGLAVKGKNNQQHKDNSLKQLKKANPKSPWPYIREGLLSGSFSRDGLFCFI